MRDQRIAREPCAQAARSSVSGLGLCDVWRLELTAEQWLWLLDEIDELRGPLEEALWHARARSDASLDPSAEEEVRAREYELKLLGMMRAEFPPLSHREGIIFTGPAELMSELVAGTLHNVAEALVDAVDGQRLNSAEARERLASTAEPARAWSRTYNECQELETFSFDPLADPESVR